MLPPEQQRVTLADYCMGCYACEIACKQEHRLPVGPRWIRVLSDQREVDGKQRFTYIVTECEHAAPGPCAVACPAGMNAWKYVMLASLGKFDEALAVIRDTTPFAGTLGRVCTHYCETKCERAKFDDAIAIRDIKRFLADNEMKTGRKKNKKVQRSKFGRVAVIGSGPAGLSCAYDLTRLGYIATVFEAEPEAGGLLRYGIPEFRLPRNVVDDEISYITELGVEIKTNSRVDNLKDIFDAGYQAVFVSTGLPQSQKLNIPGENAKGVMYALDFQKKVANHKKVTLGKRVVVIGGGSAGLDAARVALKIGAKEVHLVCLESRDLECKDRMLATNYEIEQAEKEGLIIHPGLGVRKILTEGGKVVGLETPSCTSVRDEYGKFGPQYSDAPATKMPADSVLIAIGLKPDVEVFSDLERSKTGTIKTRSITMETSMPGVFAGGDVMNGPTDAVVAIDSGKEAAISIDRFLRGVDMREGRQVKVRPYPRVPRDETKKRDLEFKDIEAVLTEAQRCFNCGECGEALEKGLQTPCTSACPAHCIYFRNLWEATPKPGTYTIGWGGEISATVPAPYSTS